MTPSTLRVCCLGTAACLALLIFVSYHSYGTHDKPKLLDEIPSSNQEKANEVSSLYHLAGGKKIFLEKGDTFGSNVLKKKNQDALSILSKIYDSSKEKNGDDTAPKGPKDDQTMEGDTRGRMQHASRGPSQPQKESPEDSESESGTQGPPSVSAGGPDMENPNEALQGLIAGWSGAGWWVPCSSVCRPRIGTKHDEANQKKIPRL